MSVSEQAIRDSRQYPWDEVQCALPSTDEGQLGLHRVIFAYCVALLSWRALRVESIADGFLEDLDQWYYGEVGAEFEEDYEEDAGDYYTETSLGRWWSWFSVWQGLLESQFISSWSSSNSAPTSP